MEIICSASSFIIYWASLQKQSDKKALEEGPEALKKKTALNFHPQDPGDHAGMVLLQ